MPRYLQFALIFTLLSFNLTTLSFAEKKMDAAALAAYLDTTVLSQLETHHVPGAAVAVVKGGELLFAKGYGYADFETKRPVAADRTLFRTGSVGKLFTWTAVMQLVEAGRLELDADVNTYLETFEIPETYREPITLRHLLTHTAGFEDTVFGAKARWTEDLLPLEQVLQRSMPARIFPPGAVTAYSNYGVTLAGYIVQEVVGVPLETYLTDNLFEPLGMTRATYQQPPPPGLLGDTAQGYTFADGAFTPHPFERYQIAPSGATSSTVTDIARFMLAFLNGGELGGQRILEPETTRTMLTRQFSNDERLCGMGFGFYQMPYAGYRVWGHKGDAEAFFSLIALLPSKDLGIYVVYNAPGGAAARDALVMGLLKHFYPKPHTPPVQKVTDLDNLTGVYLSSRVPQTTFEKINQMILPVNQPLTVTHPVPGMLELTFPSGATSRWLDVGADVFERTDGAERLVIEEGTLFIDSVAPRGYRQLSGLEHLLFRLWLPTLCLLGLFTATGFAYAASRGGANRYGYWLVLGSSSLTLLFLAGLALYLLTGYEGLFYGEVSPLLTGLLVIPPLLIPLGVGEAVYALLPGRTPLMRGSTALAALATAALLVWFNYWNLIGWQV